jgi:hypothetical protein
MQLNSALQDSEHPFIDQLAARVLEGASAGGEE